MDNTIQTPFDAILFTSASFLHIPILVALGALLYLSWRGVQLSTQVELIKGLEYQVNELKRLALKDNEQLDALTLERARLKDALKDKERIIKESAKIMDQMILDHQALKVEFEETSWALERTHEEVCKLEDELVELNNERSNLKLELEACNGLGDIDEEQFKDTIENAIIDHIQRGDLAHTIVGELASEFELRLVEC